MSVKDRSLHEVEGADLVKMELMLNHSELFRAECKALMKETSKACKRMQDEESKELGKQRSRTGFITEGNFCSCY